MIRPQPAGMTTPANRPSRPPTHALDVFTEASFAKDVSKCILHTLFFHRLFPAVRPLTRDISFNAPTPSAKPTRIQSTLSHAHHDDPYTAEPPTITHPLVDDPDLETTITARAAQLTKQLERALSQHPTSETSGAIKVHFYEKKRKKAATGFAGFWKDTPSSSDVNGVCWESWELKVTAQKAQRGRYGEDEESKGDALVRKSVKSVRRAIMRTVALAGAEKEHIPPITSAESNPFPYEIVVEAGR